jgi:hypothetical protein
MGIELAALAGANVLGGLVGQHQAAGARNQQNAMMQQALSLIQGLEIPEIEKQQLFLQLPELVGQLDPQLEQAIAADPSQMEGVSTDPRLQQAQMQALSQLQDIGVNGMTAQEAADLSKANRQAGAFAQSQQASIIQDLAQRGMSGGGSEIAMRMKAAADAADRLSQQGLEIEAQKQQRALQAIQQAGSLGGSMRTQEFGEKSDIARAQDMINQFNTENQRGVQQRNVGASNTAAAANLAEKQRISDTRGALSNQQQQYNKELIAKQYQQQKDKAAMESNALTGNASQLGQQASQTAQQWADIGSGLGEAFVASRKKTDK